MANEIIKRGASELEEATFGAVQALAKVSGTGYKVITPSGEVKLERDVDFGLLPKLKKPTLFKSGCEKIAMAYGLLQQYSIESKIEQAGDNPFFYYLVKCELVKVARDGTPYVFSTGFGSANTNEKQNGFAGAYESAGRAVKMAGKRALSMAVLAISGLSSCFTQDQESEEFMNGANEIAATLDENAPITSKQVRRIFALANNAGMNVNEAKHKIVAAGFASTKDIKQRDYEKVCGLFENNGNE